MGIVGVLAGTVRVQMTCLVGAGFLVAGAATAEPPPRPVSAHQINSHLLTLRLDDLFTVSRYFDLGTVPEDHPQGSNLWLSASVDAYAGPNISEDILIGSFGISKYLSPQVEFGAGIDADTTDFVFTLEGEEGGGERMEMSTLGIQSYLSWTPRANLNLYLGGVFIRVESDFTRDYIHEEVPGRSHGHQKGLMMGLTGVASWTKPLTKSTTLTSFAHYEVTRNDLFGFTEETGPLPYKFDRSISSMRIAKLGAELGHAGFGDMFFWGNLAWAHQFEDHFPALTGVIPSTGDRFHYGDDALIQDWGEALLGLNRPLSDKLSVVLSVNSSFGGTFQPRYGASIGFSLAL